MRMTATIAIVLAMTNIAAAQFEPPPPPRYGFPANLEAYPQKSPLETLKSVIRAVEGNRLAYMAAQLLDPTFVDAKVTERIPLIVGIAERELRIKRDEQQRNPTAVNPGDRLPDEPAAFEKFVDERARKLAFDLLVRDMRDTLADNPDHLKDLRRFSRVQEIPANGASAELTLPTLPGRGVYFQLIGKRWYLLDSQQPPMPMAPAPGN